MSDDEAPDAREPGAGPQPLPQWDVFTQGLPSDGLSV